MKGDRRMKIGPMNKTRKIGAGKPGPRQIPKGPGPAAAGKKGIARSEIGMTRKGKAV